MPELGLNARASSLWLPESSLCPFLFPVCSQEACLGVLKPLTYQVFPEPGLPSHLVTNRWAEGPLPFSLPKGPQPWAQPLSLPSTLQIGPSRFRAPELLFRPDLIGEESEGIHEVLVFAIQKSDMDLRRTLFSNIVLSGGSTLFKGWSLFSGPIAKEVSRSGWAQTPRELT